MAHAPLKIPTHLNNEGLKIFADGHHTKARALVRVKRNKAAVRHAIAAAEAFDLIKYRTMGDQKQEKLHEKAEKGWKKACEIINTHHRV